MQAGGGRLPSFYDGQVYVGLKEGIFQPSNALRCAAELIKVLTLHRGGEENVRSMLAIFTDGGPDHRTTFPSTWAALIAVFRRLDLDFFNAARTAPNNSWTNPVERIMSILNIALQGTTCQREKITADVLQKLLRDLNDENGDGSVVNLHGAAKEMEASLTTCGTMKEVRKLALKYQNSRLLEGAFIASHASMCEELSKRFMSMQLKGKPFKSTECASKEELAELFENFSSLCDGNLLHCSEVSQKVLQNDVSFMEFWRSDHVSYSDYCITLFKSCWQQHLRGGGTVTDGFSCKFGCKPPRMDRVSFLALSPLPLPRLDASGQHYLQFSDVNGQPPSSVDQPSRLAKVNEKPKVERGGCAMAKARGIAVCTECEKPRLVFFAVKPNEDEQIAFDQVMEDFDFVCGGALVPPIRVFGARGNTPYTNVELTCLDLLERLLFNAKIIEKSWGIAGIQAICIACGCEGGEAPEEKKIELGVAKLFPLCKRCQEGGRKWQTWGTWKGGAAGKAAIVQAKKLKKKATERAVKRQKTGSIDDGDDVDSERESGHGSDDDDEDDDSDAGGDVESENGDDGDARNVQEGPGGEHMEEEGKEQGMMMTDKLEGEVGQEAPKALEQKERRKKRVLRRTGDALDQAVTVDDDSDDDGHSEHLRADTKEAGGVAEKPRSRPSNQMRPFLVSSTLERSSEQADTAARQRALPQLLNKLLLIAVKVRGLRKMRAKATVRFSRALECYNPPGDGLCGFRVLFFILQLLIVKGLLLVGEVGNELRGLSTTGLRAYLLNRRTLDERKRIASNTAESKRDWCNTRDVERFAEITQISFWYARNGYDDEQQLYRVLGYDDTRPARFVLSVAVVYRAEHFQLADMSPVIHGILKVSPAGLTVASDLEILRRNESSQQEGAKEETAIDLSVEYSYEDDDAMNIILHTQDDVTWLQLFKPVMERLRWKWVRGDSEYDSVYKLENSSMKDNGQEVTGKEGLRQYFLTGGTVTVAPQCEGARKRKANSRYS
jgi:hypothetical protein